MFNRSHSEVGVIHRGCSVLRSSQRFSETPKGCQRFFIQKVQTPPTCLRRTQKMYPSLSSYVFPSQPWNNLAHSRLILCTPVSVSHLGAENTQLFHSGCAKWEKLKRQESDHSRTFSIFFRRLLLTLVAPNRRFGVENRAIQSRAARIVPFQGRG